MADFFRGTFLGDGNLSSYTPDVGTWTAIEGDIDDYARFFCYTTPGLASLVRDGTGNVRFDPSIVPGEALILQIPATGDSYFVEVKLKAHATATTARVLLAQGPNPASPGTYSITSQGMFLHFNNSSEVDVTWTNGAGYEWTALSDVYGSGAADFKFRVEFSATGIKGYINGAFVAQSTEFLPAPGDMKNAFVALSMVSGPMVGGLIDLPISSIRAGSLPYIDLDAHFWQDYVLTEEVSL